MNTKKIKLEYSESQGCYHFNYWNNDTQDWSNKPNTNGYLEICVSDSKTIWEFCKLANMKFGENITVEGLKSLWSEHKPQLQIN